ncbi:conserved membrane hypothetical protein [Gammaproteobacteria bacterium]
MTVGGVEWVARKLMPLDQVRSMAYRLAAPIAAPLYANREYRVAWLGTVLVCTAFGLSLLVPLWLLSLGPVILGVPHLLSDLRYLVMRPGLHRRPALWFSAPTLLAVSFGAGPVVGLVAMVPAILAAEGAEWRKLVLLGVWVVLTGLAWFFDIDFQLVFMHLHNLIAVALWWSWRPRNIVAWVVPCLVLVGSVMLLAGVAEPVLNSLGGWTAEWTGNSFSNFLEQIAPPNSGSLAPRFVLLFCFLQAVHYGIWLRLIPEDDRPRPAPRPFQASWRSLVDDFGSLPLFIVGTVTLAIAIWGLVDLPGARLGYLQLAAGHGYLELAAAAYFLAKGRCS